MNRPRTGYAYLDLVCDRPGSVLPIAHRGGAGHPDLAGLENTLVAFQHAAGQGYAYLETDVHATRDGVVVAFHDDVLDRVTDTHGEIETMTWAELDRVRLSVTGRIPRLDELLETLPQCRFNIDLKTEAAIEPLAALLSRSGAEQRVCVSSFSHRRISRFRRLTGGRVATGCSPVEAVAFRLLPSGRLARRLTRGRVAVLQLPHRRGRFEVVTPGLVRRAHAGGAHVHVWTVDDPQEMATLLDRDIDGIITDRTEVLKDVLDRAGRWAG